MKIDRLIGILSILLQVDKVTASELAEKFEVSKRTVIRDIEDINRAGIPIVSTQGKGGGFSIMDGFRIDRTLLSDDDMKSILSGLGSLDSVSGNNRYKQLMDKLCAHNSKCLNADNHIIIDLSSWDKSAVADKIELIKSAIGRKKKISFRYYSPNGETQRVVEPYHLVFEWASWYVWGYCTERSDYRMFKLTRITDLKETCEDCEERDLPEYVCDKLRHAKGGVEAVIKLDKSMKWRAIDEYGPDFFEYDCDGNIIMRFSWPDVSSLYRYILTYGDNAEIISPTEYREEFSRLLKNISDKYKT